MIRFKLWLKSRTNRMVHISRYFQQLTISKFARQNFVKVIEEGMQLNRYLNPIVSISMLTSSDLSRIESYLIACEETIFAAAIEVPDEYCDAMEDLEIFRDERLLTMKILTGDIDSLYI